VHYEGVRRCHVEERERIVEVINAAAVAYRGVIPDDCWHEPYMPASELDHEIAADVAFWGYDLNGSLIGVMGIQPVGEVDLIRHAYVMPGNQRRGVGAALLRDLRRLSTKPMLVGTWPPPIGRSGSTGVTASSPSGASSRDRCSGATGASRTARSRHRLCSPTLLGTSGRPSKARRAVCVKWEG
jgi:GNAT superfamily N-acetyltransferase